MNASPRPSRRTAIAAFVGAGIGAACGNSVRSDADALSDVAEQYVRLTLRAAQHQPSLVEAWHGPHDWSPGPRQPVATIRNAVGALTAQLGGLDANTRESARFAYIAGQVRALEVALRRLSGESMTFADEAREALGVAPSSWRNGADNAADVRAMLGQALPGAGAVGERVNALRRRHALDAAAVERGFTAAIDACRDRTARWLTLPPSERVTLVRAPDVGAEARAIWTGGHRTELRLDSRATPDVVHLVWLAAHETYPGHHLQHVLAATGAATQPPIERQLQPAFGSHQLYAEGAAEAGAALLLESAFGEMCHDVCRAARVPVAGLAELMAVHEAQLVLDLVIVQTAEAYLDGRIREAEALERLATEALVADAASFLTTIERQRTRLVAYPVGRRQVTAALMNDAVEMRWRRLSRIAATLTIMQNQP